MPTGRKTPTQKTLWSLPNMTHTCLLGALNDQIHISDQLIISFVKFFNRMIFSKNPIVSFIGKCSAVFGKGFMKNNLLHKWKYECDILTMDKNQCFNAIRQRSKPAVDIIQKNKMLRELRC